MAGRERRSLRRLKILKYLAEAGGIILQIQMLAETPAIVFRRHRSADPA